MTAANWANLFFLTHFPKFSTVTSFFKGKITFYPMDFTFIIIKKRVKWLYVYTLFKCRCFLWEAVKQKNTMTAVRERNLKTGMVLLNALSSTAPCQRGSWPPCSTSSVQGVKYYKSKSKEAFIACNVLKRLLPLYSLMLTCNEAWVFIFFSWRFEFCKCWLFFPLIKKGNILLKN